MLKTEEFQVLCGCGQTLDGKRREQYQRVLCKECGESIFVLPLDVYSSTQSRSGRKSKRRKKRDRGDTAEKRPNRIGAMFGLLAQRGMSGVQASKSATAATARRIFTPFRMVVIVIVLAIFGTGYWVWYRGAVEEARITLRTAKVEAEAAVESGNFFDAARHYAAAAKALDRLGRHDDEARVIRQLSRETEAIRYLADGTLFDMLLAAESAETPEDWADAFKVSYRERWMIFMPAEIVRTNGDDGAFNYSIDFPVLIGTRPVQFDGALTIFDALEFVQDENAATAAAMDGSLARSVVFAAQVADCQLSGNEPKSWVVTLRPESAFLWSSFDILAKIEVTGDDDSVNQRLQKLLSEQIMAITQHVGESRP